jgi:hypothetical protein
MLRLIYFVSWVWLIFIGIWIIFIVGEKWCVQCPKFTINVMGLISILFGVIGIFRELINSNPMPGNLNQPNKN